MTSRIKPEIKFAYDVRFRLAALADEFVETEAGFGAVRCARRL